MKKWLIVFILVFGGSFSQLVYAYDFQSGGIYYNILDGNNVEVTKSDAKYEGNIVIPEKVIYNGNSYNVTSIGSRAFYYCRGLTSITIPSSVTSIGYSAFYYCHGLTSITIPSSVTSIGDNAFYGCSGLLSVISEIQTPFEIKWNVFSSETYTEASLNVPKGKKSAYQSTSYWENFRIIKENSGSEAKRDILTWSSVSPAPGTLNELPQSINIIYDEFVNVSKKKTYIYGDVKNFPDQVPFQPGAWESAAMRFSSSEGAHFPTIPDDVYFNLKTLIFDVSDVSEDFDLKVMNGWWSNTYYDHVKWQNGQNKLQITETLANECAKGGIGCDLDLMLYSGSCTINSVYYEDKEEVTFYKNGVKQFTGQIDITEGNSKSVTLSSQEGVIADEGVWTIKVPESFIYNGMMGNVDDERWNPAFTLTYIVQSTGEGSQESKRTIHVATAGSLSNHITESEKYTIEELTLTGELNGTDFRLLRDMAGNNYLGQLTDGKLKVLDFSSARIVAGGERYLDTDRINLRGGGASGSFHYNIEKNDELPQWEFAGCKLTSVSIPNSVTSIGNDAFNSCSSLTSVAIPNSVTSIGYRTFFRCSNLTSIMIPSSVTSIGDDVFRDCSGLASITIPNSVMSIGSYAFSGCNGLTSITIPSSVTSIGYAAFGGCSCFTSIKVESGNKKYDSRNSCNAIIETSSNTLIAGCKNTTIPSSVTCIGDGAFNECSGLTSITIPNSVTSIGAWAFYGCSGLTSITIPGSVTCIGDGAFNECSSLSSITIPSSVTSIGSYAFLGTTWYQNQPDGLVYAGKVAYKWKGTMPNNTVVVLKNDTKGISGDAFYGYRGLTSITIPSSVASIGYHAFYGTTWYQNQPDGLVYAGKVAYEWKGTMPDNTVVVLKNDTKAISEHAFYGYSHLTSITIPSSVTSIGAWAFCVCSGLTSITIPSSVTSIGNGAFSGCSGLTSIVSEIVKPFNINDDVFPSYSKPTLTVPSGTKSAYQSTAGWNMFTNIVEKEADDIIQGDANGDKEVNVSDIVEMVNYIMNNASAIFLKANADLNGDGEVNVTDIVMLVNLIMSGQYSAVRTVSNRAGDLSEGDCLTIDDVSMIAGETKQVRIELKNPDRKYAAFQFDLSLPDGVTIAKKENGKLMASLDTERKNDHTLTVSEIGNNTYRFLTFSMSNAEFYGSSGALVNMTLQTNANIISGPQNAALKSQVFTATDGVQYKWSDKAFSIHVNASENTGIDETLLSGQKDGQIKVYTLTGLLLFSAPQSDFPEQWHHLPSGVYIVNGQKMIKSDDTK